ncbi:HlyD family secretion protein [Roseomonas elaeocarpi]|uniref:HlyD family secretion protein n=1 Tax=Roseomonas elaeocarpi TaxID=907779 RepID=A0ABV6JVC7_9PROT
MSDNRVRAEHHAEPPRTRAKVRRNGSDDDRSGDGKSGDNKSGDSKGNGDKSGDNKDAGKDQKNGNGNKKKSKLPIIIGIIVLLLAIAGGAVYWFLTRNLVSTDDAYTEGRAITVAPQVAGYVTELAVTDNQFVHAGDVIIRIDQRDYIAQRDQAAANLELAQAQLHSAQIDLDIARVRYPAELKQAEAQRAAARANQAQAQSDYRRQRSVDPRATTQTNIDTANAALQSNTAQVAQADAQVQVASLTQQNIQMAEAVVRQRQAQVDQAKASLAQAEVNLSYTVIRAAQDGRVTRRNVEKGAYLQQGQSVMSLVTPEVWVTANFKETQLDGMKAGQKVDLEVDAYPDLKLHGHVDSFQMGSGARFSAFPAENATGNFVKIVRRVPVKIVIDGGLPNNMPLPLGISVVPTVTVE